MAKENQMHVRARNRVKAEVKALEKMLHESCVANTFHCGYLPGVGAIIKVQRFGNNLHITIDSFDEPPERSILRLTPINVQQED